MLASLRACARPGMTPEELSQEKRRARDLYDRALKSLEIDDAKSGASKASKNLALDIDMHIELAKLWQGENLERVSKAYKQALQISQATGDVDPRLVNNIGCLEHLEGRLGEARSLYESALTSAASLHSSTSEAMSTTMLYNLARVYEDQGELNLASDAYEKLLSRHPEYIDGEWHMPAMYHLLTFLSQDSEGQHAHRPEQDERRCRSHQADSYLQPFQPQLARFLCTLPYAKRATERLQAMPRFRLRESERL